MIKFKGTQANGRILVGIGLSYENIKRLKADDPIFFDATELGWEGTDVMIIAGDTEEAINKKIRME